MSNKLTNQNHVSLSQLKTNQKGLSHGVSLIVASHAHKIRALGRKWPLVRNSEDSGEGLNSNLITSDSTILATYKKSLEHCKRNFQQRKMFSFVPFRYTFVF